MTDDTPTSGPTNSGPNGASGGDASGGPSGDTSGEQPQIALVAQYVKDLSFENPRSPGSILNNETEPQGNVSIQIKNRVVGDNAYEVLLEFAIEAKAGDEVAFVVELSYGGVFAIKGLNEPTLALALWVECPRLLFPFARRVVADATRDGGFQPLMLAPMDFQALYQPRMKESAETTAPEGARFVAPS